MPPSKTDHTTATNTPTASGTVTRSERGLGVLLIAGGLIGLIAAVTLLVEKIALLENLDYIPSCNVSPVLSCGSVTTIPQAEAFGIPTRSSASPDSPSSERACSPVPGSRPGSGPGRRSG